MRETGRVEELDAGSPVFPVMPVKPRGRVPRSVLLGVASTPVATRTPAPSLRPVASAPASSPAAPAPVAVADPGTATPGDSAFLAAFDPAAMLGTVPGGKRCTIGERHDETVPRTRRDGPRITFQRSWIAWCRLPAADRQAFVLGVLDGIVHVVPADTFGYGASQAGAGDALLPYAEPPLAGTVAVTADGAGPGLAIAIVATEWLIDVPQ